MGNILVVGATGQLGTAVVRKLLSQNRQVRALVRTEESASRFQQMGAEAVMGDLTQPATLRSACDGIAAVVTTANAAVPSRRSDTFKAVEDEGYRSLISASADARVKRFVYTSVPRSKHDHLTPFFRFKRATEERIARSGLDHVIFRASIFMDVSFAMMGSSIPVRGAEAATVLRPFKFAANHFARVKDSIEQKRIAMVPGDGQARHSFICIDDVAAFLVSAAFGGPSGIYDIGGPEALSFIDVARLYENLLGVTLVVKRTPAWVFRAAAPVLRLFSPAAANLMCLNYIGATEPTVWDSTAVANAFEVRLTSAESFLRARIEAAGAVACRSVAASPNA
jgi:uncharacterized protein YbjT (DUF2867 family)